MKKKSKFLPYLSIYKFCEASWRLKQGMNVLRGFWVLNDNNNKKWPGYVITWDYEAHVITNLKKLDLVFLNIIVWLASN